MTVRTDPRADAPSDSGDRLEQAWGGPPGLRGWCGAVNHKQVGWRFLVTAFVFFGIGGIEALFLRWQLRSPEARSVDPELFNALFTLHGTTMLFLFAIPVLEAFAVYLLPLLLWTRDLPFPRLTAFGYWTYVAGGLFLYTSFLAGDLPDGGWFAYVPLSGPIYSPGNGLDFWLLGVTFVEISGILAAIEIIVLVLRCRAPGMSIARMPIFAWAMLVTAVMILFAFPPLVVASTMLELDRAIGTTFYEPSGGGDPLLWQHLFWWFGHPEVYIMLIPALGIVSSVIPVMARSRLVGHSLVAASLVAIGIVSFGLWVHHMFTVGIPFLGLAFFAAGSLVIALPNGIQVFSWIATLWQGRVRWSTPLLFSLGFLIVFVNGGITGVMVAAVPFDQQVHDTYFVVAHFHYVILGGVVFPVLAGIYYWWPKITGFQLSERAGKLSFLLVLLGVNLTFFPQHLLGLLGMPRRVWTYRGDQGWDVYNALSTAGAFLLAVGLLLTLANLLWAWRRGAAAGEDPWGGSTLEWAVSSPPPPYNFRYVPVVSGRDPLWDESPDGDGTVGRGGRWREELAHPATAVRVQPVTTAIEGDLEDVMTLPVFSLWPLATTASAVLGLAGVLVSAYWLLAVGLVLVGGCLVGWLWTRQDGLPEAGVEPDDTGLSAVGSPLWWGVATGVVALASAFSTLVFAYVYLRARAESWPGAGVDLPSLGLPLVATGLLVASGVTAVVVHRSGRLGQRGRLQLSLTATLLLGIAFLVVQGLSYVDVAPQLGSAYGSLFVALTGFQHTVAVAVAVALVVGLVKSTRQDCVPVRHRVLSVNLAMLWYLVVALWLVALPLAYLEPRWT